MIYVIELISFQIHKHNLRSCQLLSHSKPRPFNTPSQPTHDDFPGSFHTLHPAARFAPEQDKHRSPQFLNLR